MLRFSRPTSDNTDNLWPPYCVLPQVALWGKEILYLLVAIFTSLSLFLCVAYFSFSSISFFEGGCGFEGILQPVPKVLLNRQNIKPHSVQVVKVKTNGITDYKLTTMVCNFACSQSDGYAQ